VESTTIESTTIIVMAGWWCFKLVQKWC
jgi:hypothetical protein